MSEHIINIVGVLYVQRENENGIYMQRVNPDGSDWVDPPVVKDASGITIGPAPVKIEFPRKVGPVRRFLRRFV